MKPDNMKLPVAVQQTVDATAPTENNHITPTALGPQLEDPSKAATARAAPAVVVAALVTMMVAAEATAAAARQTAWVEELVAVVIAEAEATRTATSPATHVAATMPATELRRFVAKRLLKQTTATTSYLLRSTSRPAPPGEIQAFWDHQVRREKRPSSMA
jgi:hypothetical protein